MTESGVYQLEDPAAAKPQNLPSESYAKNIGAINLALSGKAGCCVHPTKVVPRKSQALFVLSIRMRRAFFVFIVLIGSDKNVKFGWEKQVIANKKMQPAIIHSN
ncbi:hypothetical protein E2R53_10670 [Peribacillus frigoritolerans]|nr:hypothetical protein [Peribacillus frigoritolerans]TDL80475.1 hypothetical protein E2R53_10670 [Peribacillus frigoritolerans]